MSDGGTSDGSTSDGSIVHHHHSHHHGGGGGSGGGAKPRFSRYSRPQVLFLPGERVVCPSSHPLAASVVTLPPGHVIRQCGYREWRRGAREGEPCPHWLWIYTHENGSHTVVWIAASERDAILQGHMRPVDARNYLGLTWPTLNSPVSSSSSSTDR